MGFKNGTVINAANVNQHVVTVATPAKPRPRAPKSQAVKPISEATEVVDSKPDAEEAKVEESTTSKPETKSKES